MKQGPKSLGVSRAERGDSEVMVGCYLAQRPGAGYSVQQRTKHRQTGPLDKQTLKTTTLEILNLWKL